jgi:radical SAM superfamily enzyme YgiQ (UPF0313 family)
MNVCLIYPCWTGQYGKISHFANKASSYPPLNLAILAAVAEQHGHSCQIIDAQIEGISEEEVVARLVADPPNLVGLTGTSPFFHFSMSLARKIKATLPELPIIVGGPHISIVGEAAFDPVFDYALLGEADRTFPRFLETLEKGEDLSQVPAMLFRRDGHVVATGGSDPVQDLDALPVPARHLLKNELYVMGTLEGDKRYTTLATVRGCPFRCIFCASEKFAPKMRKRTPEKVVAEMREVHERYGITHFSILDETMTLDRDHFLKVCELIIREKLEITFEGSTRANLVDETVISTMRRAGLVRISFGLESVDEQIRRTMRKEVPLDAYLKANHLTNKYGIETLNSCMIGMPGETTESICKTLRFLRSSREIRQANVSIAVPYPGTELYRMAKAGEMGLQLMTEDYSQYRRYDAAVMQVGELSPEELIRLQNDAIASVGLAPWRWRPIVKKSGYYGLWLTFGRIKESIAKGSINIFTNNPKKPQPRAA